MTFSAEPKLDALERVGTALADPTRRRILLALLDGGAYPADLAEALGAGRTNISNHLACLRGCGLVTTEREGRQVRTERRRYGEPDCSTSRRSRGTRSRALLR